MISVWRFRIWGKTGKCAAGIFLPPQHFWPGTDWCERWAVLQRVWRSITNSTSSQPLFLVFWSWNGGSSLVVSLSTFVRLSHRGCSKQIVGLSLLIRFTWLSFVPFLFHSSKCLYFFHFWQHHIGAHLMMKKALQNVSFCCVSVNEFNEYSRTHLFLTRRNKWWFSFLGTKREKYRHFH